MNINTCKCSCGKENEAIKQCKDCNPPELKYKIVHKETGLPPKQPTYFKVLYFAQEDGSVWSYFTGDGGEGIMEKREDYKAIIL